MNIRVKKLDPDAKIPIYSNEHAAGFDLYSIESVIIEPNETKVITTGLCIEIPESFVGLIWDRSGLGSKGIHRFAGVIDSDYRGEIKIVLHNHNKEKFAINKGDRIAQVIIQNYYKANFQLVDNLSESIRGEKGFGSTGNR